MMMSIFFIVCVLLVAGSNGKPQHFNNPSNSLPRTPSLQSQSTNQKNVPRFSVPILPDWRFVPGWLKKNRVPYQDYSWRYNLDRNLHDVPYRLIDLMKVIYNGAAQKIYNCNGIRFKYEETPEYELGYIMAEILERYEKMTMQMTILWREDTFIYSGLDCVEQMTKYYFEIFHLVNMMQEIPAKYKKMDSLLTEGQSIEEEQPDTSAENDPVLIENIEEVKHDYLTQEYWKGRELIWKKRELKQHSQDLAQGNYPSEYNSSDPHYNPIGTGKIVFDVFELSKNGTTYNPKSMYKEAEKYRKPSSRNHNNMYDYGWDLPSDWDFK